MVEIGIGLAMNGLDLLTGMLAALKNHALMSEKLRSGLFKKTGFIVCYALAYICDNLGKFIGMEFPVSILPVIVAYTFITEATSILENVHKLNPDLLPEKLISIFQIGKDRK